MLTGLGVSVASHPREGGWGVALLDPPERLPALDWTVPGDFSSAAFFLLLGLLRQGAGPLVIKGVGLNETRTGLLRVLARMGARIDVEPIPDAVGGEPMGDLLVSPSELSACQVGGEEIPGLIDEVPILAVGAARAEGTTRISGAGELRVKETDRIRALVENLRSLGVEVEELADGLEIQGTNQPLRGRVRSFGDHRIAMAFGVLGSLPGNDVQVEGREVAAVSFPGFWELLSRVSESSGARGEIL